MRVGTMFLGNVDSVSNQSIQTRFFILGLPLVPLESHFVIEETVGGVRGFEIPLNTTSVLLGYVRWWLILPAVFAFVNYMVEDQGVFPLALVIGTWVVATFLLGRASGERKRTRRVLHYATGIAATPEMLPDSVREDLFTDLKERWLALTMSTEGADWTEVADEDDRILPLIAAVGTYAEALGEPGFEGVADQAMARIEADWTDWNRRLV